VWTKSACVVLAWGILLTLMVAGIGTRGSVSPAQANTRIARSITQVTLTSTLTVAAAPAKTAAPATRYVVRPGDTLSGIAAALDVPGGWPVLYAANRQAIGPDPDSIHPGTVLVLPGLLAPVRYTVQAGDTLSGIAAALGVRGGWPALYAANRQAIGPDPNVIHPGTMLTIAGPSAAASTRPPTPASHSPSSARHAHPARPAPVGHRHRTLPVRTSAQAPAGMPRWLRTILLVVGLLIGAAFLAELVLVIARRRRQAASRNARPQTSCPNQEAAAGSPCAEEAHIVVADYHRLVVTHHKADDTVYVLRPPGEDPKAILRVARLVLTEDPYQQLADRLGVPASWPME
jgi:LysM repeat protein